MVSTLVVIATYRRPEHIRVCLEHLDRQTQHPDRIVVVDASPEGDTRAVVSRFGGVEYRRNDLGVGATATSRAIGIQGAHEDIVAFIDDDAYAQPDWLKSLLEPYEDPAIVAVGGRADNGRPQEESEGLGQIGLLLPSGRLTGYFAADPGRTVDVDHMIGANMSIRLSAILAAGGIRDLYPGTCLREETDIALRIRRQGGRIVYQPRAVVHHAAGTYAKGTRFDARYRFYSARNHVVLLSSVFGWRHTLPWRYLRTAVRGMVGEVKSALREALGRPQSARSGSQQARALLGAGRRATIDAFGLLAGIAVSVHPRDRARAISSGEAAV